MQFAVAGNKDIMGQVDAWAQKTEGRCDTLEHQLKAAQEALSVVEHKVLHIKEQSAHDTNEAVLVELSDKILALERILMESRGKVADLVAHRQADCHDREQLRTEGGSLTTELLRLRALVENHRKELDDLHAQKANKEELFLHLEHPVPVPPPQGARIPILTTQSISDLDSSQTVRIWQTRANHL